MIKVYFPRGCYGTYVAQCLYNYTTLRQHAFDKLTFDANGSSHDFRNKNLELSPLMRYGHHDAPYMNVDADSVLVIMPCEDHVLDYYNNQFFKTEKQQVIDYILKQFPQSEAQTKLKSQWGYQGNFDHNVPRWIMREWCSFWIEDVLAESYVFEDYIQLPATIRITTEDIFNNWSESFGTICKQLGLVQTVDTKTITEQHDKFKALQKFHNSQLKCHQFVTNLVNHADSAIDVNSIFDEAYIQHLLRLQHINIKCDMLNVFPCTTNELRSVTYA